MVSVTDPLNPVLERGHQPDMQYVGEAGSDDLPGAADEDDTAATGQSVNIVSAVC